MANRERRILALKRGNPSVGFEPLGSARLEFVGCSVVFAVSRNKVQELHVLRHNYFVDDAGICR